MAATFSEREVELLAQALGLAQTNNLLNAEKVRVLELVLADRDAEIASQKEVIKTKDVQLIAHAEEVENLRVTLGGKKPKRVRKPTVAE